MDLNKILEGMITLKASDLYITVGAPVLFRVDGELRPQGEKLSQIEVAQLLDGAMDEERRADFRKSRESNFAIVRDSGRFRVSAFYQRELP
ncbi:type IV pili twitching motility protein PilT, partial [Vibrio vulnificus]|nr:type IV pili twitching motility protein PilT [Vibrio vulnificus]